jgi:enoyl-CoA hydratase
VLTAAVEDDDVRAIILVGAGDRAFSAGTDLKVFHDRAQAERTAAAAKEFFTALAECPKPSIAAVNGPAIGGGAMIASDCDVILCARHAYFSIPELSLGTVGAASHVSRLAPTHKVLRMMLLGERLTAEEALGFGSVLKVVDSEHLLAEAWAVAKQIASLNAGAVREARSILLTHQNQRVMDGYSRELQVALELLSRP